MAVGIGAHTGAVYSSAHTSQTLTVAPGTSTTLVAGCTWASSATCTGVADNLGNTWTQATSDTSESPGDSTWYLPGSLNTGGITTITFTISSSAKGSAVFAELTGTDTSTSCLRDSATNHAASSKSLSISTTAGLAHAGDLVWSAIVSGASTSETFTVPSGWTALESEIGGTGIPSAGDAWTTVAASGNQTAAWGGSQSVNILGAILVFAAASGSTAHNSSIAETATIVDSAARVVGYLRQQGESAASSDAPSRLVSYLRPVSEVAAVADSLSRLATYLRHPGELATVVDNALRLVSYGRSAPDGSTVGDLPGRLVSSLRQMIESSAIVDSVAATVNNGTHAFTAAIAETVAVTDTLARSVVAWRSIPEVATLVVTAQRLLVYGRSAPESGSETDSVRRQTALQRPSAERSSLSDQPGAMRSLLRSIADGSVVIDSVDRIEGFLAGIAEMAATSDVANRIVSVLRSIAEAVGITDLLTALRQPAVTVGVGSATLSLDSAGLASGDLTFVGTVTAAPLSYTGIATLED